MFLHSWNNEFHKTEANGHLFCRAVDEVSCKVQEIFRFAQDDEIVAILFGQDFYERTDPSAAPQGDGGLAILFSQDFYERTGQPNNPLAIC
ncbi:MAG: hypothetical protein NT027_16330 [Proteobacteria bacterium]|nr:hypothetical protein [Pseudomonadota bacterium]